MQLCLCMYRFTQIWIHTHIYIYTYIYVSMLCCALSDSVDSAQHRHIYTYIYCVCIYVCVCVCGNPLQCSCLKNSMDRGVWWAAVHVVVKSWSQPSTHTYFTFLPGMYEISTLPPPFQYFTWSILILDICNKYVVVSYSVFILHLPNDNWHLVF